MSIGTLFWTSTPRRSCWRGSSGRAGRRSAAATLASGPGAVLPPCVNDTQMHVSDIQSNYLAMTLSKDKGLWMPGGENFKNKDMASSNLSCVAVSQASNFGGEKWKLSDAKGTESWLLPGRPWGWFVQLPGLEVPPCFIHFAGAARKRIPSSAGSC